MSDEMKQRTLDLVVDNLGSDSATIRRASLRVVQELNCKTMKAIGGIVSCLNHRSSELSNDAMIALNRLLGKKSIKQISYQTKNNLFVFKL